LRSASEASALPRPLSIALPEKRLKTLNAAKDELRKAFGRT